MPFLRLAGNETAAPHVIGDELVTIGRGAINSIVLQDLAASSRHAQISKDENGWKIEDRGSSNGTFVNGLRIQNSRLRFGDQLQIGTSEFVFEEKEHVPGPATPRPPSADFLHSLISDDKPESSMGMAALMQSLVIDDSREDEDESTSHFEMLRIDAANRASRPDLKTITQSHFGDIGDKSTRVSGPTRIPGESRAETKLRLIQKIGEKLVRIFDPKQLMDEIMSIVIEQTGADRGILCLLDDHRNPVPIATRGLADGEQVRVSRTVLRRLLDEKSGVLINQGGSASNLFASLQEMRVNSTLCVPLWTGDNIIGILSLDATGIDKIFTPEDLDILMAVAHQAAIGIERGRLSQMVESERETRAYLSKYLDAHIVERITNRGDQTDPLVPAQKIVTVLFSDIVSFTKMSEGLEPQEVARFIGDYLTKMTDLIFAHGGTIDKYIGDAVMALFGAPVPCEDSCTAAIKAALAMRQALEDFKPPGGQAGKLRARFGINTGMVVVGNIGSTRRMEYTAIGDTVNVASRLQTFARPNEIVIDEGTYAKTGGAFVVEEIGAIDVKNRAQPIVVYKVLRAK